MNDHHLKPGLLTKLNVGFLERFFLSCWKQENATYARDIRSTFYYNKTTMIILKADRWTTDYTCGRQTYLNSTMYKSKSSRLSSAWGSNLESASCLGSGGSTLAPSERFSPQLRADVVSPWRSLLGSTKCDSLKRKCVWRCELCSCVLFGFYIPIHGHMHRRGLPVTIRSRK